MKKRIALHLTAFAVLLPCVMVLNANGELWINLLGVIYCIYLALLLNESDRAKRFLRRYYHEILRLENML